MEFKRDRKLHRFSVTGIPGYEPFKVNVSAWDTSDPHLIVLEEQVMPLMERALNEYEVMRDVLHDILLCHADTKLRGVALDSTLLRGWTFFDTPDDVLELVATEEGTQYRTKREGFAKRHGLAEGDRDYVLIDGELYRVVDWLDYVYLDPCKDKMHSRTAELLRDHYQAKGLAR